MKKPSTPVDGQRKEAGDVLKARLRARFRCARRALNERAGINQQDNRIEPAKPPPWSLS